MSHHVLIKTIDNIQTRFFAKLIGGWDLIAAVKQEEIPIKEVVVETPTVIFESEKQTGLKILGKIDFDKIDELITLKKNSILSKGVNTEIKIDKEDYVEALSVLEMVVTY